MRDLAQTNIQLCRQLAGWDDDDLVRLRRAYELGMSLFSGQHRANGKTQIAHHVGVASALAASGARPTLVIAGLVHSSYFLGEFGEGRLGPSPKKRARVRAAVGTEVEELVEAYTGLEWTTASVCALTEGARELTAFRRDLVAMRLANEVDEYADASSRFAAERSAVGADADDALERFVELARAADLAPLADLLRAAAALGDATPVPDVLVSTQASSTFVPPASYRRRVHVVLQDSWLGHEIAERVPGARKVAERVRRVVS